MYRNKHTFILQSYLQESMLSLFDDRNVIYKTFYNLFLHNSWIQYKKTKTKGVFK